MSDNTELAAAARNAAAWSVTDDDAAEWITQLADALVAAEAATVEARRIAEQYRDSWVRAVEGMRGIPLPSPRLLPWESPSEGGN